MDGELPFGVAVRGSMIGWVKRKVKSVAGTGGVGLLVGYGLVAGLIFLVQAIPVTGFFLMFAGASLWIGLLIHVAMVHLCWQVLRRKAPLYWLALPVLFYGGGYGFHLASVSAAQRDAAAIDARNAALRLVVDQPFAYLRDGSADSFPLIEHYRVDRAFLKQGKSDITTHYHASGDACDSANKNWDYKKKAEPYLFRPDIFRSNTGPGKTRQCIIAQDGLPAAWRYRITGRYSYDKDKAAWLYSRRGQEFIIHDEQAQRELGKVEIASFTPYAMLPYVLAGCWLNSGGPSWNCSVGLMRSKLTIRAGVRPRSPDDPEKNPFIPSADEETWGVTTLARALGLERRLPTD